MGEAPLLSSIFSIVATVVGGGILSVPYAFESAGYVLAIIYTFLAAGLSAFTLELLAKCTLKTNAPSYSAISREAFGYKLEIFTAFLLFLLILFVIIAYLMLISDILSSIISFITG